MYQNLEAPHLPFVFHSPIAFHPSNNYKWRLESSSTLLIGEGDLTAIALMFAKNCAWDGAEFLNAQINSCPILFFKGVQELLKTTFADKLWQIDVPREFPISFFERIPSDCCKIKIPSTGEEIQYQPRIYIYPPECEENTYQKNQRNFKWIIYPNQPYFRPWQSYFMKELTQIKPQPKLVFCDGWLDDNALFLRDDIVAVRKWIKEMNKRGNGIVLTASKESNIQKGYHLFDQVIKFKLWRSQKCGKRNLTAILQKLGGEKLKHPIRFHIKSPMNKIDWKIVDKSHDYLRPSIIALTQDGYTAKEVVAYLNKTYQAKLSLPMLAKLKAEWDVRTYKRSIRTNAKTK